MADPKHDDVAVVGVIADERLHAARELMSDEDARIAVLNGTQSIGLASLTTEYLENRGLKIFSTDNAGQYYAATTVVDYTGNPYTLQYLIEIMDINPNRIFHSYDPNSQIDIEINLGDDWADRGVVSP